MGTKLKPGAFDCYRRALPDEPLFTLLGRDGDAPEGARDWARRREKAIAAGLRPESDRVLVASAREDAFDMEQWRLNNSGAWRQPGLFHRVETQYRTLMAASIEEHLINSLSAPLARAGVRSVNWKKIAGEIADLFPVGDFFDTDDPNPISETLAPPRQVVPQPRLLGLAPENSRCVAIRQSDEMYCSSCGLRWGVDDLEPPPCRKATMT